MSDRDFRLCTYAAIVAFLVTFWVLVAINVLPMVRR